MNTFGLFLNLLLSTYLSQAAQPTITAKPLLQSRLTYTYKSSKTEKDGFRFVSSYPILKSSNSAVIDPINDFLFEKGGKTVCTDEEIQTAKQEYAEDSSSSKIHDIRKVLVSLNTKTYIGFELQEAYYCGNTEEIFSQSYFFDLSDGKQFNVSNEMGDPETEENFGSPEIRDGEKAFRTGLAVLLIKNMSAEQKENCRKDAENENDVDNIATFAMVEGLTKDYKVTIRSTKSPIHRPCNFFVNLGYEKIEDFIPANSRLHKLLR